jgi:hypothetical protein
LDIYGNSVQKLKIQDKSMLKMHLETLFNAAQISVRIVGKARGIFMSTKACTNFKSLRRISVVDLGWKHSNRNAMSRI